MMGEVYDYRNSAKEWEYEFRLILDEMKNHGIEHDDLSIDEIYETFTEGDRMGIWTILNFVKSNEPNMFIFGWKNIAPLSGSGSVDVWEIKDGKAVKFENRTFWMS